MMLSVGLALKVGAEWKTSVYMYKALDVCAQMEIFFGLAGFRGLETFGLSQSSNFEHRISFSFSP